MTTLFPVMLHRSASLTTIAQAAVLRRQLEYGLAHHERIAIDFHGVLHISADYITHGLGGLYWSYDADTLRKRLSIRNLPQQPNWLASVLLAARVSVDEVREASIVCESVQEGESEYAHSPVPESEA